MTGSIAIEVRGPATPEEVAAVVAVFSRPRPSAPAGYAQWRRTRLAAVSRQTGAAR